MRRFLVSISVLMLAITLWGCQSGNEASTEVSDETNSEGASGEINIAWIGKTLNNPWWISVADFAKREAANLGVNLEISLPQEEVDLENQVATVEQAIQKGSDAIVISATSSDGIIPAIEKAREAGIKIVNFDTRISDPSMYDAYVGADDVEGAYKAGKYIAEQLGGKGQVGLITGLLAQSTGVDRKEGFLKAMAEYPDIEVVAEASADWRSDLAADVTTNMLTANPEIDAIFASNDQMAVGMVNAAQNAGKAEDLILVGYDGILDAVNLVLDGSLDAFVALPNIDEGVMGPRIATALVLNENYKFERELIYPTTLVTSELVEGLTDQTIYEYAAERFPLIGITDKGY
ncbi:sugar ABC transporter substrate-binding protein [Halalkalibacter alkaliphilus]|uniref:Sugar ABC transporter substrate-binding protein n=1 Tax=Halalkalibacter alkaliphilus TaxID=2917993 RepID=A0A9X2IA84_9BACI|nr:sugar ABC transporter substrate-binding protein [Halalkalibacter alkaliphilus]MCL7749919.1 sugar ABC transporter substrate-binding protein [Halalkalibacter alkaliphilus]